MAGTVVLTAATLDAFFLGKSIGDICPCGYDNDDFNHCAHFVSHVLKLNDALNIGYTCATDHKKLKNAGAGGCLRVNEVFNASADLVRADEKGCLVYITKLSNMHKDGTMGEMKQKHIGIYLAGDVWHYHNTEGEVAHWGLDEWKKTLDKYYGGHTTVKFTAFPDGATFLNSAQISALAP